MRKYAVSVLVVAWVCASATGATFTVARIGDVDGFGLGVGAGLSRAGGGPVNVDGINPLGNGDFLPDWNGNGNTATGSGDDFDFRTAAEIGGSSMTGANFFDVASTGSHFTDISLSTSYDNSSAGGAVHVPPLPAGLGAGGPFPQPPSGNLPNQPGFLFDITVAKADLPAATPMFFNLVFGDYDVFPASVRVTTIGGNVLNLPLNLQGGGQDGLIQSAFTNLAFGDVFGSLNATTWEGKLRVDFIANNEPYTAFDFAELSTRPIIIDPLIPEPMTAATVLLAVGSLGGYLRRRRRTT